MIGRLLLLTTLAASATILPQQMKKFSALTREAHVQDGANMQMMMNPLMKEMLNVSEIQRQRAEGRVPLSSRLRTWIENRQHTIVIWVWRGLMGLMGLGVALLLVGLKGAARLCLGACHSLSHLWLLLFSLAAVLVFIAIKVNLWIVLPSALWAAPIVSALACLVLFRLIDVNFPLWNSTVTSLLAPVGACLFMLTWGKLGLGSKLNRFSSKAGVS